VFAVRQSSLIRPESRWPRWQRPSIGTTGIMSGQSPRPCSPTVARDLLDPALAGEPIGAIGARWGITNQAHFSRLFRARYEVTPSAYRATNRFG
jgi:AraC-like DNA-binding protein